MNKKFKEIIINVQNKVNKGEISSCKINEKNKVKKSAVSDLISSVFRYFKQKGFMSF